MPKVSVITAVHDHGHYLTAAIESLRRQTLTDFELIVVDDGSLHEIAPIVHRVFPHARVIRQPRRGASIARNAALLESTGTYVAILDSDDVWKPHKLAVQARVMDADPEIGLCHTDYEVIDAHGALVHPGPDTQSEDPVVTDARANGHTVRSAFSTMARTPICASTAMFRRDVLPVTGLFDPLVSYVEDRDMWFKILMFYKLAHVPSTQASYRIHTANFSLNSWAGMRPARALHRRARDSARLRDGDSLKGLSGPWLMSIRKYYAGFAARQSRSAFHEQDWISFVRYAARAFVLWPPILLRSPRVLRERWGRLRRSRLPARHR
jgi:glycosyltransferase involved in cell wall biosynthesis